MTDEELLAKIQEEADKTADNFVFKRHAKRDLIYKEPKEDGTTICYVLGSDRPLLVYRIFVLGTDGSVSENKDLQNAVTLTHHFNADIKPTRKLVPPAIEETNEYEIILENRLPDNGVEIKLKSTTGRLVTMVERYRYFDYVSRVFFVACVATSFAGQYLFSVTPDSKHIRLIIDNEGKLRDRVNRITELLQGRVLPSYRTIADGAKALTDRDSRGKVTFNRQDGTKVDYISNFCYDDLESGNRFAFFVQENDPKQGLRFIQDIGTGRLTLSQNWTDEQKAAAEKVQQYRKDKPEEFNKKICNFFADSLDLRYKAFKSGALKAEAVNPAAKPEENTPASPSADDNTTSLK
mgnify:CR=1 FL=1